MTDLSVIVLTKDEELHIGRCLQRLLPLRPKLIAVIDCFSTDRTEDIVRDFSAKHTADDAPQIKFLQHAWPGSHGPQVNWALENSGIETTWVMRLDADEYLLPQTIGELKGLIDEPSDALADVTLMSMPLVQYWMGRCIRFGTGKIILPRVFRFGVGKSDMRLMDEKITVPYGRQLVLRNGFADDNLISLEEWTKKHLGYARREAATMLYSECGNARSDVAKLGKRGFYARMPLFWRSFAYFCYRYFVRGGFLEGKAGFTWHFFQGLWYRSMVDAMILETRTLAHQLSVRDQLPLHEAIKVVIAKRWGITMETSHEVKQ